MCKGMYDALAFNLPASLERPRLTIDYVEINFKPNLQIYPRPYSATQSKNILQTSFHRSLLEYIFDL